MGNMKWVGCWIGGTLGTMLGSGILGTLAGFCLGSIIDEMMDSRADSNDYNTNNQDYYSQGNGYKQYQYGGRMVLLIHIPMKDSAILFYFLCLFYHLISSKQITKLCIQRWSLYVSSYVRTFENKQ